MKQATIFKQLLGSLVAVLVSASSYAYDEKIDFIYYNLDKSTNQATVTYRWKNTGGEYNGDIKIPSSVTKDNITYDVVSIGDSAFRYCPGLSSVNIPESVTTIGVRAFQNCTGLTKVNIPESVTSIGGSAFEECKGLTSMNIPESVTTIGSSAFNGCTGLTKVEFHSIEALLNITFGNSTANPLYFAHHLYLNGEEVTSLNIPSSVTSIGTATFCGCTGLTSVNIPESVSSIGSDAFQNCTGLTSITIPESVTTIGGYAFYGCTGLTSVNIPESVTSIGDNAFYGCTGLTSITIPESVKEIKSGAFCFCSNIKSVNALSAIPPTITEGSYYYEEAFSVYSTAFLYVPLGCEEAYGTAAGWKKFAKIREKDFGTKDCLLTIKGLSGGSIALKCKTRSAYSFLITAEEGWGVSSVTFNGSDVTADVADDGTYTTPSLTDNSELCIVFEKSGSAVKEVMTDDPLYVSASNGALYIDNADKAMKATVYTADGKKVKQAVIPVGSTRIPLSEGQLYIIKIGDRTFKVTM